MRRTDASAGLRPGTDRALVATLVVAALLCLYGMDWGRVECWHPDQMAFRNLFSIPGEPFNPGWFYRPPFHSYLLYLLVQLPLDALGGWLGMDPATLRPARLIGARLITAAMFLGMVALAYRMVGAAFDRQSALLVALILATSAGLVMHAHFLTVDIPLAFWMLLSLWLMTGVPQDPRLGRSVAAGLLVGLATATKYNGAVLLAPLVLAHGLLLLGQADTLSRAAVLARLITGLGAAGIGFVLANPYAVLDFERFADHVAFNAWVVPRYEGAASGHGVSEYLAVHPELLGWPVALLAALGFAAAFWAAARRAGPSPRRVLAVLALGLLVPYALVTAWSPRVEDRFVVPVLPVLLLLLPFAWQGLAARRLWTLALPLVAYNLLCAGLVGHRLLADPRMAAQTWVQQNARPGDLVLSSFHSPRWGLLPGVRVKDRRLPMVTGLHRLLAPQIRRSPERWRQLQAYAGTDDTSAFRLEALGRQRPRLIAVSSEYYGHFQRAPMDRLYPEMRSFFEGLLAPLAGYRVAFDEVLGPSPVWVYPRRIPFVPERMTILARDGGPGRPGGWPPPRRP